LASELCQIVGDEHFFTLHIFLGVGKTQDLPSKIHLPSGKHLHFQSKQAHDCLLKKIAKEKNCSNK
jgi:hypothetical protein